MVIRDDEAAMAPAKPRQAVVFIHGIGEQRPMETLRRFVQALLPGGAYYSKPDEISDSYELRRLKLRRWPADLEAKEWPDTDFYEYYWAHHMHGTLISHIVLWGWLVMKRGWTGRRERTHQLPPRLPRLVYTVWAITIVAVVLLVAILAYPLYCQQRGSCPALEIMDAGWAAMVIAVLGVILRHVVRPVALGAILDVVGDAARYLDVNPKNVARRYDILRGGVGMLRKLHEDCDQEGDLVMFRYGRIVLVSHSLGSVIAYDILTHYFHEVNARMPVAEDDFTQVENFSGSNGAPKFAGADPYADSETFRTNQRPAWRWFTRRTPSGIQLPSEKRKHGRWIVTDLVTMGSPLAYAPILLADGIDEFEAKKHMRELPTCPPDRSHSVKPGRFTINVSFETAHIHDALILQHHAFFAVTRWTNIFFTRDIVGGRLAPVFGTGIKDVELPGSSFLRAHSSYWALDMVGAVCVDAVRSILTEAVGPDDRVS
jgi:hypothetical protein